MVKSSVYTFTSFPYYILTFLTLFLLRINRCSKIIHYQAVIDKGSAAA